MNILMNNQNNLNVNIRRFKCVGLLVLLSTLTGFTLLRAMEENKGEMVSQAKSNEVANEKLFDAETPEDVEKSLAAGANINARGYEGWTPLHLSCLKGLTKVALMLLENGANPDAKGAYNTTPALRSRNQDVIEIIGLVSQFINIQDKSARDEFIKNTGRFDLDREFWKKVELSNIKLGRIKREPFKLPERTDKYHDSNVFCELEELEKKENE